MIFWIGSGKSVSFFNICHPLLMVNYGTLKQDKPFEKGTQRSYATKLGFVEDCSRIVPWDSSPLNHDLWENMFDTFQASQANLSKQLFMNLRLHCSQSIPSGGTCSSPDVWSLSMIFPTKRIASAFLFCKVLVLKRIPPQLSKGQPENVCGGEPKTSFHFFLVDFVGRMCFFFNLETFCGERCFPELYVR